MHTSSVGWLSSVRQNNLPGVAGPTMPHFAVIILQSSSTAKSMKSELCAKLVITCYNNNISLWYKVKKGDLVRHKYSTLHGFGIILSCEGAGRRAYTIWNCHGHSTFQNVATRFLEVISESR